MPRSTDTDRDAAAEASSAHRLAPGTAYIGLGANLGELSTTLAAALDAIAGLAGTRLVRVSSFYRSAPIAASGPDFLNAVAEVATLLGPHELLAELQRIERRHGRQRSVRNAPRTLDLDLLLHGEHRLDEAGLQVPHPRLHQRAFVLEPLAEIAPGLLLPGRGPIEPWRRAAADQRIERLVPTVPAR